MEARFQLASAAMSAEDALSQLSVAEGGRRRPQKATAYQLCRRAGLGEAVAGLGLSAERFAENVDATYKRHEPQDPQVGGWVGVSFYGGC